MPDNQKQEEIQKFAERLISYSEGISQPKQNNQSENNDGRREG